MRMRTIVLATALSIVAAATYAQRPPENVRPRRHPNLAAAQRLIEQAFARVTDAQRANEFDLDGHALKAKQLLDQANAELKLAAAASNRR